MVGNFIAFQFGWFACVLGAAHDLPWAGTGIALLIVAWHLSRAARPRRELLLVLAASIIGTLWDSALVSLGWIRYSSGTLVEGFAPHWIIGLWMLFAITLNACLAWLKRSVALAVAFGAVGGPLAYWAGERLGALTLAEPFAALVALSVGWAMLTPLLVGIAVRCDRPCARTLFTAATRA